MSLVPCCSDPNDWVVSTTCSGPGALLISEAFRIDPVRSVLSELLEETPSGFKQFILLLFWSICVLCLVMYSGIPNFRGK